jgi:hypothetical protein
VAQGLSPCRSSVADWGRDIQTPQTKAGRAPVPVATTFTQRAIVLDGVAQERSDWGAVAVRYRSRDRIVYFNLAVDERWVIRNAPLCPTPGRGALEILFYFDLGLKPGFSALRIHAATSVAFDPATAAPSNYRTAPVRQQTEVWWTNFVGEPLPPLGDPPQTYEGGRVGEVFYCRRNYPNQPCRKNECGPSAVSNSLQWLNAEYGLGIDPTKLTIDYWNTALGNTGEGLTHGAWAQAKTTFVDKKANGLPIDSRAVIGAHAKEVLDEFNGRKDKHGKLIGSPQAVEMDAGGHIAAVVCMSGPDDNGHYHLTCASDTRQEGQQTPGGAPVGNPQLQQVEITEDGHFVNSVPPCWKKGDPVHNFVVQCPHPGKFN